MNDLELFEAIVDLRKRIASTNPNDDAYIEYIREYNILCEEYYNRGLCEE